MAEAGQDSRGIRQRHRGNRLGFAIFIAAVRLCGLRPAYFMLRGVCLHYMLFDRAARESVLAYVRRRFPEAGAFARFRHAHRVMVAQGRCLIDRFAIMAQPAKFSITTHDPKKIRASMAPGQGMVLLMSHVGNWQAVNTVMSKFDRRVYVHKRGEDNAAVREALRIDKQENLVRMISPDAPFGGVVEIRNALEAGDLVCMMGDRAYGAETVAVDFMGDTAYFPYAAFRIAASSGVPVVVVVSAKTGLHSYDVDLIALIHPKKARGRDPQALWGEDVQTYATALESYTERHPHQYFVFYDVWSR